MAKDDGSIMTAGLSLAGTVAQIGGGAMFVYGVSPLSDSGGALFMGAGAAIGAAGLAIGIGNSKR